MRLPYAPTTAPQDDPKAAEVYTRVAQRRAPRPLQPLDLTLLLSPPVADGWNSFLGAIRSQTTLDPGVSEMAICRIAVLNKAAYEWTAHAPLARKGGIPETVLQWLVGLPAKGARPTAGEVEGLTDKLWAVIQYADIMTVDVRVPEEVFGEVRRQFSEREVMEITAVIAAYNMVSRYLVALDVGEKNDVEIKDIAAP